MEKIKIPAIVGPTGVGKTGLAIRLCEELNAEVVSMDSMQIYRGMDIGTAKPSEEEKRGIAHHMIDIADPNEIYSVSAYREAAYAVFEEILSRGKLPLLVGGTGLYLQALSTKVTLGGEGANLELREELRSIAENEENGKRTLHEKLAALNPQAAQKLHQNDVRRVIRAIEIALAAENGVVIEADEEEEGPYHMLVYGLTLPREQLYEIIDRRVDAMMAKGLVEEVQHLMDSGVQLDRRGGAMQAIGYKEIVSALNGEIEMEEAVRLIKRNSRRYAKRQWTWFKRDERTIWFDRSIYTETDALVTAVLSQIRADLQRT